MDRVFCCGKVLSSKFCPDCGLSLEKAKKKGENPYPYRFTIYLHGEQYDDEKSEILDKLEIEDEDGIAEEISLCDYEVGLIFELVGENKGDLSIVGVEYDGKEYSLKYERDIDK